MIDECPHGFPRKANCILCMEEGPVVKPPPGPEQMLTAESVVVANFPGHCARRYAHVIEPGDFIGYVTDIGWCCRQCAK